MSVHSSTTVHLERQLSNLERNMHTRPDAKAGFNILETNPSMRIDCIEAISLRTDMLWLIDAIVSGSANR